MIQWEDLRAALYPIQSYDDLSRRGREAFAYRFVNECFNFSMPEMVNYVQRMLGEDLRGRYDAWCKDLVRIFHRMGEAGVSDVRDLLEQVDTPGLFEGFTIHAGMDPENVISGLKFLAYWFMPMKKPIRQLVRPDSSLLGAIEKLRLAGMRFNLDLLENGRSAQARRELTARAGVGESQTCEMVNRADFSRMPWASAATISNILGAGYASIAGLAAADLEQVSADFFRYGASIGKNLKFGNEIESSHRIARIVPVVLRD